MNQNVLKDKKIIVTGGSRGLGLGVVEALVRQGAVVTVVARGAASLADVRDRLGVHTVQAEITDAAAAGRILREVRPDIVVLNAGAVPPMARLDEITWAEFTTTWDTDVKGALSWIQAAFKLPLAAGGKVILGSSGAAQNGSPRSGGYAGTKRMLWFMAKYANGIAREEQRGIHFQVVVPQQLVGDTGVGNAGADAYAAEAGISREAWLQKRFPVEMSPRRYGELVVDLLTDPAYAEAVVVGLKGDTGVTVLDAG